MTSVLVVDDAPLFQAGIAAALNEAGFDVTGQAQDAMTAVSKARQLQPDIVVLDVLMPGLSGLDVVDKICDAAPDTSVVLLTSSESEEDLLSAIKSGASGYVVKDTPLPPTRREHQRRGAGRVGDLTDDGIEVVRQRAPVAPTPRYRRRSEADADRARG